MIKTGILNPHINMLLSRVRHTNMLVIADRGFPFWPTIETIDITLIDDIPTVLQVLHAIRANFVIGEILIAGEFREHNSPAVCEQFDAATDGLNVTYLPHDTLKQHVPNAIGLIRTGDTIPYANMILISA
jgi:D-ribose pyranase